MRLVSASTYRRATRTIRHVECGKCNTPRLCPLWELMDDGWKWFALDGAVCPACVPLVGLEVGPPDSFDELLLRMPEYPGEASA